MRAFGCHIDCIEGLTPGHEQTVSLWATKTKIAADLGEFDLTNELPLR